MYFDFLSLKVGKFEVAVRQTERGRGVSVLLKIAAFSSTSKATLQFAKVCQFLPLLNLCGPVRNNNACSNLILDFKGVVVGAKPQENTAQMWLEEKTASFWEDAGHSFTANRTWSSSYYTLSLLKKKKKDVIDSGFCLRATLWWGWLVGNERNS